MKKMLVLSLFVGIMSCDKGDDWREDCKFTVTYASGRTEVLVGSQINTLDTGSVEKVKSISDCEL